jgi:hypothetical protein
VKKIKKRQLKIGVGVLTLGLLISVLFFGWSFLKPALPMVSDAKISHPSERQKLDEGKPRRFRSTRHQFLETISKSFNRQGLEDLNASASAQFTLKQLKTIVDEVTEDKNLTPDQFIVVDLRQETHLFINGYPISFFSTNFSHSWGNSTELVKQEEDQQQKNLSQQSTASIHYVLEKGKNGSLGKTFKQDEGIHHVQTEEMVTHQLGVKYVRFAVSDHMRPSDDYVDQFISFIKMLPDQAWLHFHCRGGIGRASVFMTMYDILRNGKNLKKDEILNRQIVLGGKNFSHIKHEDKALISQAIERENFIHKFYSYVQAADGFGVKTWSEWTAKN